MAVSPPSGGSTPASALASRPTTVPRRFCMPGAAMCQTAAASADDRIALYADHVTLNDDLVLHLTKHML